jgi:uncharacterized membrane protein
MNHNNLKKLILSALFLAIGFILPMLIGQIPVLGKALLPMHIPVLLCSLICGWKYGSIIGFILPILRSFLFSVPVMYPTAIAVAFEMTVYGIVTGLLYERAKRKTLPTLYLCLIISMLAGRIVRCIAEILLLELYGNSFVWQAFMSGTIINSIPGIILQLIVVPAVMLALKQAHLLDKSQENKPTTKSEKQENK